MWRPLHDLAWSLRQGKLHELFLKDSLTLATWGLVVVTFLLVLYSSRQGKEQRQRWDREDEQHNKDQEEERARWKRDDDRRSEELRPKFTFGLDQVAPGAGVVLWCANLGSLSFQVEKISTRRVSDPARDIDSEHYLFLQRVVPCGERMDTVLPPSIFRNLGVAADLEICIFIDTSREAIQSPSKVYSFVVDNGTPINTKLGFHERRRVPCPKCEATAFLDPNGLMSRKELNSLIMAARRELETSCPSHASTLLSDIIDSNGRQRRLKQDA